MLKRTCLVLGCLLIFAAPASSGDLTSSLKKGTVDLKSAGPLAFGPDGVLFVGDAQAAAVFAIATGDTSGSPEAVELSVKGIDQQVAAALGITPKDLLINDLAVNPASGQAYLSVSRGTGPDATVVLLRVDGQGEISEVSLQNVKHAKAELPNAPNENAKDGRGRGLRAQAITDITYLDGKVLVAGLSTEEFASTLRSIPFPFDSINRGTGVEVFHGAHGKFETHAPVRTFASYEINEEPYLLAAYTCTPLVRFPLSDLASGERVRGTTVAELGNRNRPLDMFVYEKGDQEFILMANNRRGMMKISTEGIDRKEGITEHVGGGGTAGQSYDTIASLSGVVQLDRLNSKSAVVIQRDEDGALNLRTVALP